MKKMKHDCLRVLCYPEDVSETSGELLQLCKILQSKLIFHTQSAGMLPGAAAM